LGRHELGTVEAMSPAAVERLRELLDEAVRVGAWHLVEEARALVEQLERDLAEYKTRAERAEIAQVEAAKREPSPAGIEAAVKRIVADILHDTVGEICPEQLEEAARRAYLAAAAQGDR
jgi:hypothetical protein